MSVLEISLIFIYGAKGVKYNLYITKECTLWNAEYFYKDEHEFCKILEKIILQ